MTTQIRRKTLWQLRAEKAQCERDEALARAVSAELALAAATAQLEAVMKSWRDNRMIASYE